MAGSDDGNGTIRSDAGKYPPDLIPRPDPTRLTDAAIERATDVFRREIQALRETIETRLTAADDDRDRTWERLRDLPALVEQSATRLREELLRQDAHDREVLTQRLDDLDTERSLTAVRVSTELEHRRREFLDALDGVQAVITQRMSGQDQAVQLMAGETARALATAEAADERVRTEVHALVTGLRELIEQRLGAMDLATKVLAGSVEKFPTDIDRAVGNIREVVLGEVKRVQSVTEEKFTAIDGTFSSNALALTAALAAQKEAAAEQNKSNTLAITKSESSTKETIAANAVQAQTGLLSLENQFDDVKARVIRLESMDLGARQQSVAEREVRGETHNNLTAIIMAISVLIALVSFVAYQLKKLRGGGQPGPVIAGYLPPGSQQGQLMPAGVVPAENQHQRPHGDLHLPVLSSGRGGVALGERFWRNGLGGRAGPAGSPRDGHVRSRYRA